MPLSSRTGRNGAVSAGVVLARQPYRAAKNPKNSGGARVDTLSFGVPIEQPSFSVVDFRRSVCWRESLERGVLMLLTMRSTGPSSPNDQRLGDFAIYSGEWAVGRIYDQRGGPEHMRWFWSLYGMSASQRKS